MSNERQVFAWLVMRSARRRPATALVVVFAIAVGTAVITAVDLANEAAIRSFAAAVKTVGGQATHELRGGPDGVVESILRTVQRLPGVVAANPVIETVGLTLQSGMPQLPVHVVGLDPLGASRFQEAGAPPLASNFAVADLLGDPLACVVPAHTAAHLRLSPGSRLPLAIGARRTELRVVATFPDDTFGGSNDDWVVVDIATAQEQAERLGWVDRVDLIVDGPDDALRAALPAGVSLEKPQARSGVTATLLDSFRLNLRALSVLALIVGTSLAFNAMHYSVAVRRPLIAQARALGAERRAVLLAILVEAAVLGFAGGALGLVGGWLATHAILPAVSATVSSLYTFVDARELVLPARVMWQAPLVGIVAAVLAAWFPALDAASTSPRLALSRAPDAPRLARARRRLGIVALGGALVSAGALLIPSHEVGLGYLAMAGLLVVIAAATPLGADVGLGWFARALSRTRLWLPVHAARSIQRSLTRTGASISALAMALAMTIGVVTLVSSFRETVGVWLEQVLQADIYIAGLRPASAFEVVRLPPDVETIAAAADGVERVEVIRGGPVVIDGTLAYIAGMISGPGGGLRRFVYLDGLRPEEAAARAARGEILVSETFSFRHRVDPGDRVTLPTIAGPREFTVGGRFFEYSVDAGYLALDVGVYQAAFGVQAPRSVAVFLRPGVDASAVAARLDAAFAARHALRVHTNARVKADAMTVFEQTFATTRFLRGVAVVLALLGVSTALAAIVLERRRELASMRAVGLERRTQAVLLGTEGILLAGSAAVMGVTGGWIAARILVSVINLRAFGWSLVARFPSSEAGAIVVAVLVAAALAAAAPARWLERGSLAESLREE